MRANCTCGQHCRCRSAAVAALSSWQLPRVLRWARRQQSRSAAEQDVQQARLRTLGYGAAVHAHLSPAPLSHLRAISSKSSRSTALEVSAPFSCGEGEVGPTKSRLAVEAPDAGMGAGMGPPLAPLSHLQPALQLLVAHRLKLVLCKEGWRATRCTCLKCASLSTSNMAAGRRRKHPVVAEAPGMPNGHVIKHPTTYWHGVAAPTPGSGSRAQEHLFWSAGAEGRRRVGGLRCRCRTWLASGRLRLVARPSSGELAATPTWGPRALHCACRRVFDTGQCALDGLRHRWRLVECFRGQLNAISTAREGKAASQARGAVRAQHGGRRRRPGQICWPHLIAWWRKGLLVSWSCSLFSCRHIGNAPRTSQSRSVGAAPHERRSRPAHAAPLPFAVCSSSSSVYVQPQVHVHQPILMLHLQSHTAACRPHCTVPQRGGGDFNRVGRAAWRA